MRLLICCMLFLAAPAMQDNTFQQLKQLEGTWKMQTTRRTIFESWKVNGNSEMAGWSYILRGTDTVTLEKITLRENADGIFYIPAVSNQNEGKPIPFKLVNSAGSKFIFENKQHDFPQRVIYHLAAKDSVHAWIEGTKDGTERRSDFYYKRVN